MTRDEAMFVLNGIWLPGPISRISAENGGVHEAVLEALRIARECIKLCIDFGNLQVGVGDKIYWPSYDEILPEESTVCEYTIGDISINGYVYVLETREWYDLKDEKEDLFLTEEEACKRLEEIKNAGTYRKGRQDHVD